MNVMPIADISLLLKFQCDFHDMAFRGNFNVLKNDVLLSHVT